MVQMFVTNKNEDKKNSMPASSCACCSVSDSGKFSALLLAAQKKRVYDKLSQISDSIQTFFDRANFVVYMFHGRKAGVIEASVTPAFRLGNLKRLDSGFSPNAKAQIITFALSFHTTSELCS
jgi:hypothetical protein